jgi:hypothetical protein
VPGISALATDTVAAQTESMMGGSMQQHDVLRLELDAFDIEDLKAELGDSLMSVDKEKPTEAFGEPITIAVIILTPIAIKAIAAWLTKNRHRVEIFDEVEVVRPDGSRERHRMSIKASSSVTEPDVVKQLVSGLNLDPKLVKAAAALAK